MRHILVPRRERSHDLRPSKSFFFQLPWRLEFQVSRGFNHIITSTILIQLHLRRLLHGPFSRHKSEAVKNTLERLLERERRLTAVKPASVTIFNTSRAQESFIIQANVVSATGDRAQGVRGETLDLLDTVMDNIDSDGTSLADWTARIVILDSIPR